MSSLSLVSVSGTQISLDSAEKLINAVAGVVSEVNNPYPDVFTSKKPPKIKLLDFFDRILKYCKLDEATFVALMIFLDKASDQIALTNHNIHKLILGAMICSVKYCCDELYSNSFYARVGGITLTEMNKIEVAFLNLIDFKMYIEEEKYERYSKFLL